MGRSPDGDDAACHCIRGAEVEVEGPSGILLGDLEEVAADEIMGLRPKPRDAGRNAPSRQARVAEAQRAEPVGGASRRARPRQFCRGLASLNWPRLWPGDQLPSAGNRPADRRETAAVKRVVRGSLQEVPRCITPSAAKLLCEAVC